MLITTAVVALSIQVAAPARVATVEVKGEPIRLAWSADGSQLAIQTGERDKAGMLNNNPRFYVLSAAGGKVTAQAWPEWAEQYWTWKSNKFAPWAPALGIEPKMEQKTMTATASPMGGGLAKGDTSGDPNGGSTGADEVARRAYEAQKVNAFTLTFLGETVGYMEGMQLIAGYTFGWAPKDLAAIAYVNGSGRLAVMDKDRNKQQVESTKNVILPAWSVDGSKIAFLQKVSKNKYDLYLAAVTK